MSEETDFEIPLYSDTDARDDAYAAAQRDGEPFFGMERYEAGHAVTYDLLPAGRELTTAARQQLGEVLTAELEDIVGDESVPTTEVSRSVGASLGQIAHFERESTARRVASTVGAIVLDEENWVEASEPPSHSGSMRND